MVDQFSVVSCQCQSVLSGQLSVLSRKSLRLIAACFRYDSVLTGFSAHMATDNSLTLTLTLTLTTDH